MTKALFDDFNDVSSKQWKQRIQYDLKGKDYNESLVWETDEGIHVKPFYHADAVEQPPKVSVTKAANWKICQSIFVANVQKSNQKAVDAIARGAQSITFVLPQEDISLKSLLTDIDTSEISIFIKSLFLSEQFLQQIHSLRNNAQVYLETDIIGQLARSGNWFKNFTSDHDHFKTIVKETNLFTVGMDLYQNAGANMVQQLAYGMAHANEYLNTLDTELSSEHKTSIKVCFNVAMGTNYFFEIAKLRALRLLWRTLAKDYGFNPECIIYVRPTKRNKTLYDYNTNMLRTTSECMSAILGGADTICNLPYDAIYHKDNEFAERMARNQLLILKHESYFDKVNNPADGSYYIEDITQQLATKALELFKDIEVNGGFLHQLKEGVIQKKIKESAAKEQSKFDNGELVLLGTNKHPNTDDKMKSTLELFPFVKRNPVKTLIEPIIERRLAESVEQKRLEDE